LLCDFNPALAQQYGWKMIAKPTTSFISAVNFVDSLNGWIGCILADADKAIFRTRDGGYTWQRQIAPQAINVNSISFIDPLNGWMVGNLGNADGYIIHTNSGGAFWEQQLRVSRHFYGGLSTFNPSQAIVTGGIDSFFVRNVGLIVRTSDSGKHWQEQHFLNGIGKVEFVDTRHGWASAAIGDSTRFIRTVDGGKTWTIQPYDIDKEIFGLTSFDFIDSLQGWAVGRFSYPWMIHTNNSGRSWKKIYKFPFDNTSAGAGNIAFADTLNGWMFGDGVINGGLTGVIYRTTDGGKNWFREQVDYRRAWTNGEALDLEHIWAVSTIGEVWRYGLITAVQERETQISAGYALLQNYPNPFNPTTQIEYHLPKRTHVILTVHDLLGKEVRTLVRAVQEPGIHQVSFDASEFPAGAYFYKLKTNDFEQTQIMTLLK
jgi:photosystem II stability/assembly factor-like uncharacterized protein